jgi:hypothetical protein
MENAILGLGGDFVRDVGREFGSIYMNNIKFLKHIFC